MCGDTKWCLSIKLYNGSGHEMGEAGSSAGDIVPFYHSDTMRTARYAKGRTAENHYSTGILLIRSYWILLEI